MTDGPRWRLISSRISWPDGKEVWAHADLQLRVKFTLGKVDYDWGPDRRDFFAWNPSTIQRDLEELASLLSQFEERMIHHKDGNDHAADHKGALPPQA